MPFFSRQSLRFLLVLALAVVSVPAVAAEQRRRAARPTSGASLSGRVTDTQSGAAVFEAEVLVQGKTVHARKDGSFTVSGLSLGDANIEFRRWGYQSRTRTQKIRDGVNTLNVTLEPKPVATLINAKGESFALDLELGEFQAHYPLVSPQKLDEIPFCKTDASEVNVVPGTIRTIVGPGTVLNKIACCKDGDSIGVTLTLVGGEPFDAILPECRFYRVVFTSRDRADGEWRWFRFTEIARLELPR